MFLHEFFNCINTSIRESSAINCITHLCANLLETRFYDLTNHHSSRNGMWIINDIWNHLISSIWHFMCGKELRDNGLTSLSRWHLIALFEVSRGSKFDSNINDMLFILNDMYVFNTSRFIVFIQERSVLFGFMLALWLLFRD